MAPTNSAAQAFACELRNHRARMLARRTAADVLRPLLEPGALERCQTTSSVPVEALRAELARIVDALGASASAELRLKHSD